MASEKQIERGVIQVYSLLGCEFLHFSQPRASKQTLGIPDLLVCSRRMEDAFWFEVKAPNGKQSKHQQHVQELLEACGMKYRIGGTIEAIECANELLGVKLDLPHGERWKGKKL